MPPKRKPVAAQRVAKRRRKAVKPRRMLAADLSLHRDGVAVYRVFSEEEAAEITTRLKAEIKASPEFKDATADLDAVPVSGGGFAALGNASSFHSPAVVEIREKLYQVTKWRLKQDGDTRKLECLFDRVLDRKPGQSVGSESAHRDECGKTFDVLSTDSVFGGWVALESKQVFRFVPGSHRMTEGDHQNGFAKLTDAEKERYMAQMCEVEIPVGCAILFYQNIVHSVAGSKARILRLFHGYRLTHSTESLVPGLQAIIDAQGVVSLKSGQMPPMIPKLWNVNWQAKRDAFFLNLYGTKTPWHRIDKATRVHHSLAQCGLPLWPAYDTDIYFPHAF